MAVWADERPDVEPSLHKIHRKSCREISFFFFFFNLSNCSCFGFPIDPSLSHSPEQPLQLCTGGMPSFQQKLTCRSSVLTGPATLTVRNSPKSLEGGADQFAFLKRKTQEHRCGMWLKQCGRLYQHSVFTFKLCKFIYLDQLFSLPAAKLIALRL